MRSPSTLRARAHAARTAALVAVILVLFSAPAVAQRLPEPEGFINDFANVISSSEEASMRGIITALREQTGAEIAVVTVESMAPYATIEDYAIALAEEWGVGSAEDDSGVLIVVSTGERRITIQVGYGLEGALPDGRVGSILDQYVVPDLRDNNYGAGLLNGVAAVAEVVADEYGVELTGVAPERRAEPQSSGPDLGDLIYVVFIFLAFGGRWFFWPLLFSGRRRGFFGGGFGSSGGSSSSRFSGFGGGGFGGGGASRGF